MELGDNIGAGIIILLIGVFLAAPLLVYHFLVFPNIDGVFNDLSFYENDGQSQHFLYWFFFWGAFTGGSVTIISFVKKG